MFTINFMCMTSYFHVISGSTHPKKDGGVAENLVRVNAFKSENPLFTVIIHPSYVNGKDHVVSFQLHIFLGFRNATPINFDFS